MAQTTNTNRSRSTTQRKRTSTQRSASAKRAAATRQGRTASTRARRTSTQARSTARSAGRTAQASAKANVTGIEALATTAQRPVLIGVGAALTARDNVVETVTPFLNRETAEREITKLRRQVNTD